MYIYYDDDFLIITSLYAFTVYLFELDHDYLIWKCEQKYQLNNKSLYFSQGLDFFYIAVESKHKTVHT